MARERLNFGSGLITPRRRGIWVPNWVPAPEGWFDPNRTTPREDMIPVHEPGNHREKASVVVTVVDGQEVAVVGGGEDFTEDLKDIAERYAEEEKANAPERAREKKERAEAAKQEILERLDKQVTEMKRSWRTNPNANRTKNKGGKKVF